MANALYDKARESFLSQSPVLDWDTDNLKVTLVKSTYTPTLATDQYYNPVLTASTYNNGDSANLGTKTVAAGVADAADTSLTATSAVACNAIVIWKDTGTPTTSPLIAYIDTATGLPVTPAAGGTVNIVWDNGANKIFKL
jgi:hypothetical protein